MFRSSADIRSHRQQVRVHRGLLLGALCVWMSLTSASSSWAQGYQQTTAPPNYPPAGPAMRSNYSPAAYAPNYSLPVEPAAYSQGRKKDKHRPLHPLIVKMPQAEEEMEVIHHRSQLVITRSRITRWAVADTSVIDVLQYSPTEISIIGQQMGATHLTLWFEGEQTTDPVIYRVEVIRDPNWENQQREDYGKLERQLQVLFPNSQVYLVPLSFRVIVKGQARDQEEAAQIMNVVRAEWQARNGGANGFGNGFGGGGFGGGFGGFDGLNGGGGFGNNNNNNSVINMLEVPGEQMVMVHVRIAQLDRAQLRRLGINLNQLIATAGNAAKSFTVDTLTPGTPTTLSGVFENGQIQVILDWLATNSTAKITAEPSITVMNGTTAGFQSGGEFPVPTITGLGGGTTTTFRSFGTSLVVTPTIIDKDLIRMRIVPEFSAINAVNGSGGVPGLDTRRATTTVQLREGQTIALAGLFSSQSSAAINRIPLLGELPYIGVRLFNNKLANQDETELLFLVTPEIVRPMDQDEVPPPPGFYVTPPNDYELYHYAMTEGAPDQGIYQLAPYGWGPGMGTEVGYRPYNPALGMIPPGPPNGIIGGSLQPGGFGFPGGPTQGGQMPNGGYSQPMMMPSAPANMPGPMPDPSVRYSPRSNNPLLSSSSAEAIANPQKPSWNPLKRFSGKPAPSNVQPAGYNSPQPMNGPVQPAGYQAPRSRY